MANNFPAIRPTLNLNFAATKRLDPRITFTRASTATYYDGRTQAKAEENLVLQSQTFDNSSWTKLNATITANAVVAPDGTTTADALFETVTNGLHRAIQTVPTFRTASMYIQGNGRTKAWIYVGAAAADAVTFDLSAVTVTAGASVTGAIVDAGGGWYRCIVYSATDRTTIQVYSDDGTGITFAGDITKGLYLWGAQAENRTSVTAYTATTTAPITNYVPQLMTAASGVPRFHHNPVTGESLGLLIEAAGTNLALRSEEFQTTWTNQESSEETNVAIAPDGTLTADKLIPTTVNDSHWINQTVTVSTVVYTFSFYAKAAGYSIVQILNSNSANDRINFDLSNGTVGSASVAYTGTITSVGNGWYRCTGTFTPTAGTAGWVRIGIVADSTSLRGAAFAGDGTSGALIWGAQFETGSIATSYIPTTTATVTRAIDSATMTGANFSSWYNASEGTFVAEAADAVIGSATDIRHTLVEAGDATTSNVIRLGKSTGGGTADLVYLNVVTGGTEQVYQPSLTVITANTNYKVASSYKVNDFDIALDGGAVAVDNLGTIPMVSRLTIGARSGGANPFRGTIKSIAYYPKALPSSLVALTQ